jgi:formate-dependent nitrite reductase membrane component NrfD
VTDLVLLVPAQTAPSDTFYTVSPHWGWLIVVYFFLGGIAGGAAFLAAVLHLFGNRRDRPMARVGYAIAFPAIVLAGPLLIVDLNRPERFWHMFIQKETFLPMFKWYSPISIGAWGVGAFALFATLAFAGALAEWGRLPAAFRSLAEGTLGRIIAALTGLGGLFVAGYTGVLLSATNRPLWADSTLIGLLFLLSGVSAGAAAMLLVGWRRANRESVEWVGQMDFYSTLLELAVLAVLALSLGSVLGEVWGNGWGVLLVVGTVLLGLLVPMLLHWRPRLLGRLSIPSAAVLVLVGGLVLRMVVVLSSEAI